ncbi:MAG: cytochrome c-type biogenesis protein CcmH [Gammaproteobacteria bacterium]|nr:MAG: cytochrome c-type biogenesis protein CcmH [Gammaproteobacteria bacterium]
MAKPVLNTLLLCVTLVMLPVTLPFMQSAANAAVEVVQFDDKSKAKRYYKIISELRCLVCQNQNLAESNAPLAKDLRRQVYKMLNEDKTDAEIYDYMVSRYGEFVLYNPPLRATTLLLWIGPFIFLGIGVWSVIVIIRRRARAPARAISNEERSRLQGWMDDRDSASEGTSDEGSV